MTASITDLFTEHLTGETAGECPQLLVMSCFYPFHDFDTSTSTGTSTSTSTSTRVGVLVPVHAMHWCTGVHWCVLVYCCMAASQESCQPGVMPARSHALIQGVSEFRPKPPEARAWSQLVTVILEHIGNCTV